MIINIILPLALLVAMNICIYRTMRSHRYTMRPQEEAAAAAANTAASASVPNHLPPPANHNFILKSMSQPPVAANNSSNGSLLNCLFCNMFGRGRRSSLPTSEPSMGSQHLLHSCTIRRTGYNESEFKKRDFKYTRASVAIVIVFVVCNAPRLIPNIMEIFIDPLKFPEVSTYVHTLKQ